VAAGDTAEAMAQYRKAVDVGNRTNHPIVAESTKKLKALEDAKKGKGK